MLSMNFLTRLFKYFKLSRRYIVPLAETMTLTFCLKHFTIILRSMKLMKKLKQDWLIDLNNGNNGNNG